ncbi:MAG: N-6 DNA methylase [Cyanobacteria bacterium MAG IRC4_bin_6]|nr:N-6 DNA methylase [Cyanobacteria bacterium MAG IRC3_bin_20]MDE0648276.1 N-6 DNA methylase [Cyanobacteria bacterium MAG IRC4_bin_6]
MRLIADFISKVQTIHATGQATEHSYRPAFVGLFLGLGVTAMNEPKRVNCGAPDFSISRDDIVVGHLEAKDLHIPIRGMKDKNKSQQERYKAALPNLIYTNGLDWDFYRHGDRKASVVIAEILEGRVTPTRDHYERLERLLQDFIAQRPQTITSPSELAQRMAGKAGLIKDVLRNALAEDGESRTELSGQYQAFKENLIRDINPEDFADIYAETIAYGMFAARLHDTTPEDFSRQKALHLLPRSNPFLRNLFTYIAGYDLDDRIAWIIDDLALVFRACKVEDIMEDFGQLTGQNDPFLHFYETFLAAYNPAKRKARGVWYTPQPVVNFIVRAVDEVLRTEFGLPDGLADTSKVAINQYGGEDDKGKPVTIKKEVHRVQILDPATGTGTFLGEVIKQIAARIQGIAPGMWSNYIEADLIPRLHGFELLMASYAMCHMKLDMILTELGYRPTGTPPRLSVYLTNSLEASQLNKPDLPFAQWISREADGANRIKRDMPIMSIIGNPPYLGEGGVSKGWISDLIEDYKKEPGGKMKLKEKNPKWLNDLYVKFIRLSSHLIEKNGEGVLGFITNHGYLDNPTFRGMRWHLLHKFDRIWVLDLHGNAKKREVAPDQSKDENVFDIQQGVAIIIAVKHKDGGGNPAQVMQGDLWGPRQEKYDTLQEAGLSGSLFTSMESPAPQHLLVRRYFAAQAAYGAGFSIKDFMPVHSVGIVTARDALTIDNSKDRLWQRLQDFLALEPEEARAKYRLGKDVRDWKVAWAQADLRAHLAPDRLVPITYRPFDTRWTYYTGRSRGFICYPREEVMQHMIAGKNITLICKRGNSEVNSVSGHVVDAISESRSWSRSGMQGIESSFPLYLYPDQYNLDQTRRINFDDELYVCLQARATHPAHDVPDEVAVFDYIYGVLHCPVYRETYAEFLKTDFPRIPWPATPAEFWDVSTKGAALRKLHLMDPTAIGPAHYPFTGEGDNMVRRSRFKNGRVYINADQYFDSAPEVSWGFYIGGYQPARKWLKDRKGHVLSFDDVKHYQRILKILSETDRIMRTIKMTLAH